MQRCYAHRQGILTPYIFPKAYQENKTTSARMLQGQGQKKGDTKVIEVKGQGHFAILVSKKVHILLFMTFLS